MMEKMVEIFKDEKGTIKQNIECSTWEYGLAGYIILRNFAEMLNELSENDEKKITAKKAFELIETAYRKGVGENEQ